MKPCHSCSIYLSCDKRHEIHNKGCLHRPLLNPMSNLTKGFAEMGRKRIAISGGGNVDMVRIGNEEHMLRLSAGEGAWD